MRIVKVECPVCGSNLETANNLVSVNCPFCGAKVILDWDEQTNSDSFIELGLTFLEINNYQKADEYFTRALEKNSRNTEAWFWKGFTLLNERQYSEGDAYITRSGYSEEEVRDAISSLCSRSVFQYEDFLIKQMKFNDGFWKSYKDVLLDLGLEQQKITRRFTINYLLEVDPEKLSFMEIKSLIVLFDRIGYPEIIPGFLSEINLGKFTFTDIESLISLFASIEYLEIIPFIVDNLPELSKTNGIQLTQKIFQIGIDSDQFSVISKVYWQAVRWEWIKNYEEYATELLTLAKDRCKFNFLVELFNEIGVLSFVEKNINLLFEIACSAYENNFPDCALKLLRETRDAGLRKEVQEFCGLNHLDL